jgi:ketosteroid isomerase-like protein
MNLPFPIQAYFDADNRSDGEALMQVFAPDAVIRDEGRSHAGRQAIDAWRREVKRKYRQVIEPLAVVEKDAVTSVRARVAGDFPGSPATLTFAFRIEGDQITSLEIGA